MLRAEGLSRLGDKAREILEENYIPSPSISRHTERETKRHEEIILGEEKGFLKQKLFKRLIQQALFSGFITGTGVCLIFFLIYDKDREDGRRGRRIEEKILLGWDLRLMSCF